MVAEKAEGSLSLVARLFGGVGGLSSSPSGKGDLVAYMQSPIVPSMKTSMQNAKMYTRTNMESFKIFS